MEDASVENITAKKVRLSLSMVVVNKLPKDLKSQTTVFP